MKMFYQSPWRSGCTLALLLLHCGWAGLARGQDAASDVAAAAKTDQPEADEPAEPLEALRKQHLELAIAIAADFSSPAQQQAANVVLQNRVVDSRFDAPVRAALEPEKDGVQPSDDKRIVDAVALLPHTTIEPSEQVSLLLDLLIARSSNERSRDGRLFRQGRLEINVPGISAAIVSRLTFLPEALAEEVETRLAEDQAPVVLYAAVGFAGEYGIALLPRLLAAADESDDRFVKAAVFQSVERIFAADREARVRAQRDAAANSAARRPSSAALNALADKTNISIQALEYAARIIQRNDKNGDGVLTEKEWADMLVDPSPADTNQDGQITVEEYAAWMENRGRR